MATWVMSGYAVSAVEVLSGGSLDSFGATFRIAPTWDASADALAFTVTDDDSDLQGDAFSNESGDDFTQSAVVTNAGGSTLYSGRVYLEKAYTFTDQWGTPTNLFSVEIGGVHVGWVANRTLQPGDVYTVSGTAEVTGANDPSYWEIAAQNYDPDSANSIQGTSGNDVLYAGAGNDTIYYGDGANTVYGGSGNDVIDDQSGNQVSQADLIYGGSGNDTIYSGNLADTLYGDDGSDVLYGEEGNDLLYGGLLADTLVGGNGNDTLAGGSGADSLDGGAGSDFADYSGESSGASVTLGTGGTGGSAAGDTLTSIEGLIGSDYGDTFTGSDTAGETLYGGAGADSLSGGGGADVVYGGAGADTLTGGTGNDTLYGDADQDLFLKAASFGHDTIYGGGTGTDEDTISFANQTAAVTVTFSGSEDGTATSGADSLTFDNIEAIAGSSYADSINAALDGSGLALDGGAGNDTIAGGSGNDSILGGTGDDSITDGAGADTIVAGLGSDTVYAGAGNDLIYTGNIGSAVTGASADTVYAGDGNDAIHITELGYGSGWIDGGTGSDTIFFDYDPATMGGTTLRITMTDGTTQPLDGIGGDQFFSKIENVTTGAGTDSVTGNSAANIITTAAGSDTLGGGAGADTLYAGSGADLLDGGSEADVLYGGTGDDTLAGGSGNDTLYGEAGADSFVSGAGNDAKYGGEDADTFSFSSGFGSDSVYGGETVTTGTDSDLVSFSGFGSAVTVTFTGAEAGTATSGTDTLTFSGIERLVLGDGADVVYGGADTAGLNIDAGAGADTITGGSGADSLEGGTGADIVQGGAGADTMYGGAGTDALSYENAISGVHVDLASGYTAGGAAGDVIGQFENLTGSAFADTLEAGTDSNLFDAGAGNDSVNARAGDDTAYGGSGSDTLRGREGSDSLSGGDDADILQGDSGDDTLVGGAGADQLTGGTGYDRYVVTAGGGADTATDFDVTDDDSDGRYNDQIDVSGLTAPGGGPVYARHVTVSDDGFGNALLTFPGGETLRLLGVTPAQMSQTGDLMAAGIPCFVAGTSIATPSGPVPVERLRRADVVATPTGPARVLWIGRRWVTAAEMAADPALRPVRIAGGVLGNRRTIKLSRQHGVLIMGPQGGRLIRAAHLARLLPGVRVTGWLRRTSYHHLLLPRHAILWADGLACESFYPGRWALAAMAPAARARLLGRLPAFAAILDGAPPEAVYGPRVCPLAGWDEACRLALDLGRNHGRSVSQPQTVSIDAAVASSTDEAATRLATPYMLAKT